jgi:hypothetical protein
MMRPRLPWLCLSALLLVAPALAAPAGGAGSDPRPAPRAKAATAGPTEWSESERKALRDRDEARQRLWDQKMKSLTGSICTGC